jgi:HAAS
MTPTREHWLQMVAHSLRGSRRRRRRLLAELEGHLDDAAAEEMAAGLAPADAEAAALRRLGAPDTVAADWNVDVAARRTATRLRIVVLAVLAGALLTPVALAQRSGPSHPRPVKPPPATIRPERGAAPARAS